MEPPPANVGGGGGCCVDGDDGVGIAAGDDGVVRTANGVRLPQFQWSGVRPWKLPLLSKADGLFYIDKAMNLDGATEFSVVRHADTSPTAAAAAVYFDVFLYTMINSDKLGFFSPPAGSRRPAIQQTTKVFLLSALENLAEKVGHDKVEQFLREIIEHFATEQGATADNIIRVMRSKAKAAVPVEENTRTGTDAQMRRYRNTITRLSGEMLEVAVAACETVHTRERPLAKTVTWKDLPSDGGERRTQHLLVRHSALQEAQAEIRDAKSKLRESEATLVKQRAQMDALRAENELLRQSQTVESENASIHLKIVKAVMLVHAAENVKYTGEWLQTLKDTVQTNAAQCASSPSTEMANIQQNCAQWNNRIRELTEEQSEVINAMHNSVDGATLSLELQTEINKLQEWKRHAHVEMLAIRARNPPQAVLANAWMANIDKVIAREATGLGAPSSQQKGGYAAALAGAASGWEKRRPKGVRPNHREFDEVVRKAQYNERQKVSNDVAKHLRDKPAVVPAVTHTKHSGDQGADMTEVVAFIPQHCIAEAVGKEVRVNAEGNFDNLRYWNSTTPVSALKVVIRKEAGVKIPRTLLIQLSGGFDWRRHQCMEADAWQPRQGDGKAVANAWVH